MSCEAQPRPKSLVITRRLIGVTADAIYGMDILRPTPRNDPLLPEVPLFETVLAPIHRAGWPLIAAFAAATVLLWWLWMPLGLIGLVLTAWCVYFFRDPARVT